MKALILNSGLGHRMGVLTSEHPKCMTEISHKNTILSRQLRQIADAGIKEVVMTTGYYDQVLIEYCNFLNLPIKFTFVNNPLYDKTNYIYSIYCAKEYLQDDDIVLMHGDLVFENIIFDEVVNSEKSVMTVSSTIDLPEKDFKAVIKDGKIVKVGIEFFNDAMAAQLSIRLIRRTGRFGLTTSSSSANQTTASVMPRMPSTRYRMLATSILGCEERSLCRD